MGVASVGEAATTAASDVASSELSSDVKIILISVIVALVVLAIIVWAVKKGNKRETDEEAAASSKNIYSSSIHQVHSHGVIELLNSKSEKTFKVNGQRLKPYIEPFSRDKEVLILHDPSHPWESVVSWWA